MLTVLDICSSNNDGTSINIWNVLKDQSIFRILPYNVDFYRPVLNFGRLLYPKVLGWDTAPVANMALLSYLTTRLDLFAFGPNEMSGNEGVEVMADAYKYTIVGDIIDSIKPEAMVGKFYFRGHLLSSSTRRSLFRRT